MEPSGDKNATEAQRDPQSSTSKLQTAMEEKMAAALMRKAKVDNLLAVINHSSNLTTADLKNLQKLLAHYPNVPRDVMDKVSQSIQQREAAAPPKPDRTPHLHKQKAEKLVKEQQRNEQLLRQTQKQREDKQAKRQQEESVKKEANHLDRAAGKLEQEIGKLDEHVKKLENNNKELIAKLTKEKKPLNQTKVEIIKLKKEINSLKNQPEINKAVLQSKSEALKTAKEELSKQNKAVKNLTKEAKETRREIGKKKHELKATKEKHASLTQKKTQAVAKSKTPSPFSMHLSRK